MDYLINLWNALYTKYTIIRNVIDAEFGSFGVMIVFLFTVMLLLIISLHIKSVIETFHEYRLKKHLGNAFDKDDSSQLHNSDDSNQNNSENQETDEKEISKLLIKAAQISAEVARNSEDYQLLKKKMKRHAQKESRRLAKLKKLGKQKLSEHKGIIISAQNTLKRKTKAKTPSADSLPALILTLLRRKVSEPKIAQALFFHYKDKYTENDIIQMVHTLKDFVAMNNTGKFAVFAGRKDVPEPEQALLDLTSGDISSCLVLLQAYLNHLVAEASEQVGLKKEITYASAANCSCMIGNIAKMKDPELAQTSFEMATELSPKNANAWCNLGDNYMRQSSKEKAMIAFQSVLDFADPVLYAPQIASAHKQMSDYYLNMGITDKAQQYTQSSTDFYTKYGILLPLTEKEDLAYKNIITDYKNNIKNSVHSLLNDYSL